MQSWERLASANREQKEGEKEELKYVRAGMCRPWRPLMLSLRNQVWCGEQNRNCVFSGTEANLIRQALGSLGKSLCGTAEGKQRKDTAREVVDGPWEAEQMWASVRDAEEKERSDVCEQGQHDTHWCRSRRQGMLTDAQDRIF